MTAPDPSGADATKALADRKAQAGETAEAIALYRQAAEAFAREGDPLKAQALMRKALRLGGSDGDSLWRMAELTVHPRDAIDAWRRAADALSLEGRTERAEEARRKTRAIPDRTAR